jgi:hypothetical protein
MRSKLGASAALVGILAALLAAGSAAPAAAQVWPHWARGQRPTVTVYLERRRVSLAGWSYLRAAAARWNRSPRIHLVPVGRCPTPIYCVHVVEVNWANGLAGLTVLNHDDRGQAWYGTLLLNRHHLTSPARWRKTACHELGHVAGLQHRASGRTCMRADGFRTLAATPDAGDYQRLLRIYADGR